MVNTFLIPNKIYMWRNPPWCFNNYCTASSWAPPLLNMLPAWRDTHSEILEINEMWSAPGPGRAHLQNRKCMTEVAGLPGVTQPINSHPFPWVLTRDLVITWLRFPGSSRHWCLLGSGSGITWQAPRPPYSHHTPQHTAHNGKGELFGKLC